ncbi:MAG: gamma-glutamylcyclotransferase [Aigarchaeota archaeon]|nr:gamma-glutamylcyclotransferase [Candidatus Pelearchaeum maunauluense]
MWYFAYGANLDREMLRRIIGGWSSEKKAWLRGFSIKFDAYSTSWRGGVADIVEDPDGIVYGAVYQLEEEQLKTLDRYEGVPTMHARRIVVVETEEGQLEAVTYVVSNPRGRVAPSQQYLSSMIRGLRQHGYDERVIALVRKAAMKG